MAGYTPVFDSVFTGTLSGKYPDTAAWLFLLALADKHGVVDMTPAYISLVTGMPESSLVECITRFMEPDPYSRTIDEEGRRLVPIDPARPWGWKIVNHRKYREKARLQAREVNRVDTGENAERMKGKRRPPLTPADPPSNTDTLSSKEDICLVFEYWREAHNHPRAALDAKRKKVIASALKSYPVDDLKLAIDGCKASPFHQGENDRNAKYDSLALILRDAEQIDKFMALATQPVQTKKLRLLTDA